MQLTKYELFAIKQYIDLWYLDINCLMDSKFDSEKRLPIYCNPIYFDEDFKINDILQYIKDIYSSMIKLRMNDSSIDSYLYRGTNACEINKFINTNTYNKFLSTTDNFKIASRFTNSKDDEPAILIIKTGDLPYININSVAKNHVRNYENEFILAPYSKINSLTLLVDGEKKIYGCELEKKEFTYISNKQLALLKSKINSNFETVKDIYINVIKTKNNDHNKILIYNQWKQLISTYLQGSFYNIRISKGNYKTKKR